jgi:hypothetical protein
MKSVLRALVLVQVLGCERGVDIVARALDQNELDPTDAVEKKTADPGISASCAASNALALVTRTGELVRFDLATKSKQSQAPTCIPAGAGPIALDRTGMVWAQTGSTVVAASRDGACKSTGLSLTATAMGFVDDRASRKESLYAVVDGVLLVINEATLARTPIGELALEDVRGLAGTSDGRLFAFAGGDLVTIAEIALGDASIAATWLVKAPRDLGGRFAGGAVTNAGFELVFGPYAYAFAPAAGTLVLDASLFPEDPGVVGIGAAPCYARAK